MKQVCSSETLQLKPANALDYVGAEVKVGGGEPALTDT